jgi:hypothetical protein
MGRYLGSWKIDDIVYVTIQTSSVTTGAAADADAAPTWRVYEDSTATPVTTGSFATLNAQIGFYVAPITLAAAIGYEKGKTYSVRTQATVAAIIGADVHGFQIEAEVDANTVSGTVPTVTNVTNAVTVGATSVAVIADAVWDETGSDHTSAGSFGGRLNVSINSMTSGAIGPVTVGATAASGIAAAVWDKTAAAHNVAGSFGELVNEAESLGAIVNAIWDEPKANHTTADTFGEFLDATVSGISGGAGDTTVGATAIAAIAAAVWDESGSAHTSAGSFGARLNVSVNSMTSGAIGSVTLGSTSVAAVAAAVTAGGIGAVTIGATAAAAIAAAVEMTVGATAQTAIADAIWDEQVDGGVTARQSMRLHNSALGGKASGLDTTEATYRDLADTKDRIVATVDTDGNRTAVTRDLT